MNPIPSLIFRPRSFVDRLTLSELFPKPQPLELELGSGDGSFLAQYAAAHPGHNFIGVERLLGRLRKLDRKGLRSELQNLRLIRLEASYVLEYLVPSNFLLALHVYFPDPWPKRRHHKNRLVTPRFTESCQKALEPKGRVYLRTDDPHYFEQMQSVFRANLAFREIETPPDLAAYLTDFEQGFLARGVQTRRAAYERTD